MHAARPKAVVLLSGGLDSATTLAIATDEGFASCALTFAYGQRHSHELDAARLVAKKLGADEHVIADLNLRLFGGSALTSELEVPKSRRQEDIPAGIPITYVPARNTIFLSYALAWAEALGASDIFIGVNAVDYSGYPDCRPEYIVAFERMGQLATRAGVQGAKLAIHTPLIDLTKAQIIKRGLALGVDYAWTCTCYDPTPDGAACGHCDACLLRLKGFGEVGIDDPVHYQAVSKALR